MPTKHPIESLRNATRHKREPRYTQKQAEPESYTLEQVAKLPPTERLKMALGGKIRDEKKPSSESDGGTK